MRIPRVRFTVRRIMVLVLVVGLLLGWTINRARRQEIAVAAILRLNGDVIFDEDMNAQGRYAPRSRPPQGPLWLRNLIGPEYFRTLRTIWVRRKVGDAELSFLNHLTQLRTIHLVGTNITDDGLTCLRSMPRLWGVDLVRSTRVTDASAGSISGLTDLKELYLNGTQFTDAGLSCVRGKSKLQTLFLGELKITDAGLENLAGLTDLKALGLGGTRVTDTGLVRIGRFRKLGQLGLQRTQVTDAGLVHLEGLTNLWGLFLDDTAVTDAGLVHLKGLTGLTDLHLDRTGVTQAGIDELQKSLPKTKIVWSHRKP